MTGEKRSGDILHGRVQGGRFLCTFPFSFEITEGEDRPSCPVSRREAPLVRHLKVMVGWVYRGIRHGTARNNADRVI